MAKREKRKATLGIALIPVLFLIIFLMCAVLPIEAMVGLPDIQMDAHVPLFTSAMFAALIAIYMLGYTWAELEEGIVETIRMSMGAILILMVIGMLIGTWIISGIVPAMVYYGLDILSPGLFLVATLLVCSIVSLATGTSWGTAGTVGIALVGIGTGLGIPLAMTGGAVISGAYFGDKMSPLSDTTNLAPAMAGSTLFDHIRHMIFTTGPSYVISLILFGILGAQFGGNQLDASQITAIQEGLTAAYTSLNPILLIGPILVIAIVILKVPALPGLFGGVLVGAVFGLVLQGASLNDVLNSMHYGYTSETGNVVIDELLSRGGMDGMMWTINLILCAMCFGGVMEKSGMLETLAESILKIAHGRGGLVTATVFSCIALNVLAGDQYLSIVIPGRMYRTAYEDMGLAPRNLSRALEDSGTLSSALIPWNTCGATMIGMLGLTPWTYVPYCFLNIINPIVSIFYGFTGITMMKLEDDPTHQAKLAAEATAAQQ